MNSPLITVLLPTYNSADTIRKAIDSVLGQSFKDFEFIIIDDGSDDNTEHIVQEINDQRIRYLKNEKNLGIQKSLNKGVRHAVGEYIARIDSDDSWQEVDKLEKQIEYLQQHKDCVVVGTGAVVSNEQGQELFRYIPPTTDQEIREKILSKNCFLHPSVVIRKEALEHVDLYDESKQCLHIEDYDLWLKLGSIGTFANLPIYGIVYTVSQKQISSQNKREQLRKNLYLIKKYKNQYPGYVKSLFRCYARIILYGYLKWDTIKNWYVALNNLTQQY